MKFKIFLYNYLCRPNKFVYKFCFKEIEESLFFSSRNYLFIIFCLSNRIGRLFFHEKEEEKEIKKKRLTI
jgi:hypothetical protein